MMRTIIERALAVAVIAAYPLFAFYPFHFELPQRVENGAHRAADGTVSLPHEGLLVSAAPPRWLEPAIADGRFSLILDVVPASASRRHLSPILTVSRDSYLGNLTIGQHGKDLSIQLRTTESGRDGMRHIRVPKAFAPGKRTHVNLRVFPAGGRTRLEVRINGIKKASQNLPRDLLSAWNPSYRLALGNAMSGNRPWLGTIHRATVRAGNVVADYAASGAAGTLERPARYWTVANDPDLVPFDASQWHDVLTNLFGFMPLGMIVAFALWRRRGRVGWAPVPVALAMSFLLETAQLMIPGRTPALSDLIFDTLGGLIGGAIVALVFTRVARRARDFRQLEADPI